MRTFHQLEIRIDDTSTHRRDHRHDNGVGFAEVRIGPPATAPTINEVIRLPTDLLADVGQRRQPAPAVRGPDQGPGQPGRAVQAGRRAGDGPHLHAADRSELRPERDGQGLGAGARSGRSTGCSAGPTRRSPTARAGSPATWPPAARARLDGDPATYWSPARGPQEGDWISADLPHPVDLSHWTMQVVADGLHSVPDQAGDQDRRPAGADW